MSERKMWKPGKTVCSHCEQEEYKHKDGFCYNSLPLFGHYYLHKDGGIYKADRLAINTVTGKHDVIYDHIYPFQRETYTRPLSQWTEDRYKSISETQLWAIQREFQLSEYQDKVRQARHDRQVLEKAAKQKTCKHSWYVTTSCTSYFVQVCRECGLKETVDKD